ncbi:MAG: hypothetical protein M1835_003298 [Candelina submexicana]|nr:MAG: hypothetical protein M1835_003298 [Candelina submexicana]
MSQTSRLEFWQNILLLGCLMAKHDRPWRHNQHQMFEDIINREETYFVDHVKDGPAAVKDAAWSEMARVFSSSKNFSSQISVNDLQLQLRRLLAQILQISTPSDYQEVSDAPRRPFTWKENCLLICWHAEVPLIDPDLPESMEDLLDINLDISWMKLVVKPGYEFTPEDLFVAFGMLVDVLDPQGYSTQESPTEEMELSMVVNIDVEVLARDARCLSMEQNMLLLSLALLRNDHHSDQAIIRDLLNRKTSDFQAPMSYTHDSWNNILNILTRMESFQRERPLSINDLQNQLKHLVSQVSSISSVSPGTPEAGPSDQPFLLDENLILLCWSVNVVAFSPQVEGSIFQKVSPLSETLRLLHRSQLFCAEAEPASSNAYLSPQELRTAALMLDKVMTTFELSSVPLLNRYSDG